MFNHKSVLLDEVIQALNIKKDGIYVDCTLGGAGHAKKVLEKLQNGVLVGIDQDIDAIDASKEILKDFNNKIIVKDNFENIKNILEFNNIKKVDGIYMDLGVSSYQFDEKDRGFSYQSDAIIDMRMDRDKKFSAKDILNSYSEKDIADILYQYGEEKFSRSIARNIIEYRKNKKIETTFELVDIIKKSVPFSYKKEKHPAKKTFQALRIYVNDELNVLKNALTDAVECLNDKGRLCIITFHSLEDRIVKEKFREFENPCTCIKGFPCVCGKKSKGRIVNKKPIVPQDIEIDDNNRARSAHLRIFEKINI